MADLQNLLDRNRSVAEHFEAGDLPIRPRMSTIILTCLDQSFRIPTILEFADFLNQSFRIRPAFFWVA